MSNYLPEFFLLFSINFLNVISPGACFAIVVRNSAMYTRRVGVATALGVALSSCIQKTYVLLGFGLFISQRPMLFHAIKYIGCAHLVYLAYCSIRNSLKHKEKTSSDHLDVEQTQVQPLSPLAAFRMGFLTDSLNPQASFGFMSIVLATVNPATPIEIQSVYAFFLVMTALVWYVLVALGFSNSYLRSWFRRVQHWFERLMGGILIGLSFRLAMITVK